MKNIILFNIRNFKLGLQDQFQCLFQKDLLQITHWSFKKVKGEPKNKHNVIKIFFIKYVRPTCTVCSKRIGTLQLWLPCIYQ